MWYSRALDAHHPFENRKIRVKLEREMQTRVRKRAASTGSFPIEPDQYKILFKKYQISIPSIVNINQEL